MAREGCGAFWVKAPIAVAPTLAQRSGAVRRRARAGGVRPVLPLILDENRRVAVEVETSAEALAHLLAIIKFCEEALDENGLDVEARVLELTAHSLPVARSGPGIGSTQTSLSESLSARAQSTPEIAKTPLPLEEQERGHHALS